MNSHKHDPFTSDLDGQHNVETPAALGAELAGCEAELSEFEQDAVRSYWDQVIAEELGEPELMVAPFVWSELGTSERTRLRRYKRRTAGSDLRLIIAEVVTGSNTGEAA